MCVQIVKLASSFVHTSIKPIRYVSQDSTAHFLPSVRCIDVPNQTYFGSDWERKKETHFSSETDVSEGRVDVKIIPPSLH